jgi:hypothetical protein
LGGNRNIIFTAAVLSSQGNIGIPYYVAAKSKGVGPTKALSNDWSTGWVNFMVNDNIQVLPDDPGHAAVIPDQIPTRLRGRADKNPPVSPSSSPPVRRTTSEPSFFPLTATGWVDDADR